MATAGKWTQRSTQGISPHVYADAADREALEVIALFDAGNDVNKIKQLAKSLYVGLDTYQPGRKFGLQVIAHLQQIAGESD